MRRYVLWFLLVFFLGPGPLMAVVLQVQTETGDTTFFAPVGDTVTVVVRVNAEGKQLTGVEFFLRYDPRLFVVADTLTSYRLLGQVLVDTALVLSDSVGIVHYAEANLTGKAVSGRLFRMPMVMVGHRSGVYPIDLLTGDGRLKSVYTAPSLSGDIFAFEQIQALFYADLPPVLTLPESMIAKEDQTFVLNLRTLATDAESGLSGLTWQIAGSTALSSIVLTDTLTAILHFQENFHGQVPLFLTVTDAVGGQIQGRMVLTVLPVNDAPTLRALPNTLLLPERDGYVSLVGIAQDVDGDALSWAGEGQGAVQVVIEEGPVAHIFAPLTWTGEAIVRLRVRDPGAAGVVHEIRVIRNRTTQVLTGDLDGDRVVGFSDFLIFAQNFGQPNPFPLADFNGDGAVGFSDFLVFAQNFGRALG